MKDMLGICAGTSDGFDLLGTDGSTPTHTATG